MRLMFASFLVGTKYMIADVFTKAVDAGTMETMIQVMSNSGEPSVAVSLPYSIVQAVKQLLW